MRLSRLADPLGLVIAAAGIATAVMSGTWWIGVLGLGAWLAIAATGGDPAPPPPPTGPVLSGTYAETAARLHALRRRIADAVASAAPVVRGCMEDVPGQVALLVGQCETLLAKQAQLDRFLTETDDPRQDIERHTTAAAAAADPAIRTRWEQAAAAARARLDELARIRTNRDRTAADLAEVEARLKQVLSQVVAMDSTDQSRLTGMSSELHSSLGELAQQVTVMDRILRPEDEATETERGGVQPVRQ